MYVIKIRKYIRAGCFRIAWLLLAVDNNAQRIFNTLGTFYSE